MAVMPAPHIGPDMGGNFEYQWSGDFVQAHLLSDVGKKRNQNEDACVLCAPDEHETHNGAGLLIGVADGMGGANGGGFASQTALQTIVDAYYGQASGSIPDRLGAAIEQANERIFQEADSRPELQGMGTTVSLVVIKGEYAYIAQVGDSRVYLSRHGRPIQQLTDDHSLVAEQVRNGFLSENEARNHSMRNLITRAVGTRKAIKADLFFLRLERHDSLLICSDGLSNVVSDEEIDEAMHLPSLQGAARILVGHALEGGAPDNITVAALRVTKTPPHARLEEGALHAPVEASSFLARLKGIFT